MNHHNRFDEELEFELKAFTKKESRSGLFRTGALIVETNKDSYKAREKVTISMNMPGDAWRTFRSMLRPRNRKERRRNLPAEFYHR
jgi:hypothetical protein